MKRKKITVQTSLHCMAESQGFEPWVRYHPTHDFQSCALDHSANSPRGECSQDRIIVAFHVLSSFQFGNFVFGQFAPHTGRQIIDKDRAETDSFQTYNLMTDG